MKFFALSVPALLVAASISMPAHSAEPAAAAAASRKTVGLSSGLFPAYVDTHVKPQDDFFRHVNGHWLNHNGWTQPP